jgi:hypothetical protein
LVVDVFVSALTEPERNTPQTRTHNTHNTHTHTQHEVRGEQAGHGERALDFRKREFASYIFWFCFNDVQIQ